MISDKTLYQAKINHILKLKNKKVFNHFQITKKKQIIKTHPSKIRVTYPYFQITDTDKDILELSKNYERIFIIYKKLNQLTKLNFFVNLPPMITTYCTHLYAIQALHTQSRLKLLSDKFLQRLYKLYLTTQYKFSAWKYLQQITEGIQYKSKTKKNRTIKTKRNTLKKKHYLFIKLKKILMMKFFTPKLHFLKKKHAKKVYFQIKHKKYRNRFFIVKGQKLFYSVLFKWFKKLFNAILKFKFFTYLKKNLHRLQKGHHTPTTPHHLTKVWERFTMRIKQLTLKRSFKKKIKRIMKPCFRQVTQLLKGYKKLLCVKLQYTTLKKVTKTKYNLLSVNKNKQPVVIPLSMNKINLPTFNFLSLYNWPLGRISNYHFFKSQLPAAIQKKYYLPTFFTSVQQLNLTKMNSETKNLFEFFFFPATQVVTEPMIESILQIILTYWNLQPISSSKVTKSKELYTLLDHLYTIKTNEDSTTTTKNIFS